MTREINQAGVELIQKFEGLRLDAYQDVAGIWTIGYGHIRGVQPGMHITTGQAQQALQDDLVSAETVVETATTQCPPTENQFAAMVSLCFNIGSANFRGSTVLREHAAGNTIVAANAFLLWNKARVDGVLQEVAGLTARRSAERSLYLTP